MPRKKKSGQQPWTDDPEILERVPKALTLFHRHAKPEEAAASLGISRSQYYEDVKRGKQLVLGAAVLNAAEATAIALSARDVIEQELYSRLRELEEVTPNALEVHRDGTTEVVEVGSLERIDVERKLIETIMKNREAIEALQGLRAASGGGTTINDNRVQMAVVDGSGRTVRYALPEENQKRLAEWNPQTAK